MHALIDGDIILYSCGFAAQNNWHRVYITGEEENGYIAQFKYKKDLVDYLDTHTEYDLFYETEVEVEPFGNAAYNVNQLISRIIEDTGATTFTIFLTGKDNFRDNLVDYYKKNRDPAHKPVHYEQLKQYLFSEYNAEIVDGMEADDAMGIAQYTSLMENTAKDSPKNGTIICTTDKDLKMIPGWHYNWDKRERSYIKPRQATHWFYTQLLTGDPTDNIKGIPKIGKKRAESMLAPCETEQQMYAVALEGYNKAYDLGMEVLQENADLLWILREKDVRWTPPI